jgi:RNA polymerase sigma factor (sigma-70 family)
MTPAAPAASRGVYALWNCDSTKVTTDEQFLQQFLTQDGERAESAFATLVERYGPIVHRVCRDVLGSSDEAQDAAQAVFLVLARKARSIRKPGSLGPWLHGVALRVARRARSEAARRRAAERRNAELTHERNTSEKGPEIMDHAELHEQINRLPDKYRLPIILCYMKGQTQTQAAEALGWPLGTVQIRLHRGRERLRSSLTRGRAGLVPAKSSDLMASLAVTPVFLKREWTHTTARAAVRFAAGKETAGLITPPVSRLAESVLAAMLGDTLKVIALTVISLLLVSTGVWLTGRALGEPRRHRSLLELEPASGRLVKPEPASGSPILKALDPIVVNQKPTARPVVPSVDRPLSVEGTAKSSASTTIRARSPNDDHADKVVLPAAPASPGRSLSLAMAGRLSEKTQIVGRELFERVWVKDDPRGHGGDGLGPVFNGQSCVVCHNLGGTGGAGGIEQNIDIGTISGTLGEGMGYSYSFSMDFGAGRFEYRMGGDSNAASRRQTPADTALMAAIHPGFREARSIVLHRFGTDPAYNGWRESVPGRHGSIMVQSSQRNPPSLFGTGLIDGIPDAAIEAAAKRRPSGSAQIKGRVSRLKDGRVGRFGWKAQTATLSEFVRAAAAGEIGLDVPGRHQAADPRLPGIAATGFDMDENECNALIEYVRGLPAPIAGKAADDKEFVQMKAGEATFKSIGCTACHLPKLGDVEGIFSDLLLHDMGPQLGDVDAYAVFVGEPSRADRAVVPDRVVEASTASVREWRTPPLWGLRDSGPFMHDGRAASIAQAIMLHAGQGATAARRYAELSPRRKQQLEAFLSSLTAPSAGP